MVSLDPLNEQIGAAQAIEAFTAALANGFGWDPCLVGRFQLALQEVFTGASASSSGASGTFRLDPRLVVATINANALAAIEASSAAAAVPAALAASGVLSGAAAAPAALAASGDLSAAAATPAALAATGDKNGVAAAPAALAVVPATAAAGPPAGAASAAASDRQDDGEIVAVIPSTPISFTLGGVNRCAGRSPSSEDAVADPGTATSAAVATIEQCADDTGIGGVAVVTSTVGAGTATVAVGKRRAEASATHTGDTGSCKRRAGAAAAGRDRAVSTATLVDSPVVIPMTGSACEPASTAAAAGAAACGTAAVAGFGAGTDGIVGVSLETPLDDARYPTHANAAAAVGDAVHGSGGGSAGDISYNRGWARGRKVTATGTGATTARLRNPTSKANLTGRVFIVAVCQLSADLQQRQQPLRQLPAPQQHVHPPTQPQHPCNRHPPQDQKLLEPLLEHPTSSSSPNGSPPPPPLPPASCTLEQCRRGAEEEWARCDPRLRATFARYVDDVVESLQAWEREQLGRRSTDDELRSQLGRLTVRGPRSGAQAPQAVETVLQVLSKPAAEGPLQLLPQPQPQGATAAESFGVA